jgi:hypothetical protein
LVSLTGPAITGLAINGFLQADLPQKKPTARCSLAAGDQC